MLAVLATHSADIKQLQELLKWCLQLGEQKKHDAIIVADSDTPFYEVKEAQDLARLVFNKVSIFSTDNPVKGWTLGANSLFRLAARSVTFISDQPWIWIEPDCVPLKSGWLDAIEADYVACGKKYMGAIYPSNNPSLPTQLMSGIAVYHQKTFDEIPWAPESLRAFDVDYAEVFLKDAAPTRLIFNLWGEMNNPPRFADKAIAGTAVFSIDQIPKEAVLYHRQKDGSLIRQLRKKMGIAEPLKSGGFVDVLNFCQNDAALALENIKWQRELGGCGKWDCLMAHESSVSFDMVKRIEAEIRATYGKVFTLAYPPARIPGWPSGPNWGFQHIANFMHNLNRPWLFHEPDFWPLCRTWLDQLQEEYAFCGKACMGNIVKDFGHLQGTSIYPADLPARYPKIMAATSVAFDTVSKEEVLRDCHPANSLLFHLWGLQGGEPHHFVGTPVRFATVEQVKKWIPAGAVAIHRVKDKSIADRLREMGTL